VWIFTYAPETQQPYCIPFLLKTTPLYVVLVSNTALAVFLSAPCSHRDGQTSEGRDSQLYWMSKSTEKRQEQFYAVSPMRHFRACAIEITCYFAAVHALPPMEGEDLFYAPEDLLYTCAGMADHKKRKLRRGEEAAGSESLVAPKRHRPQPKRTPRLACMNHIDCSYFIGCGEGLA
jgi:hypothetical protein